MVLSAAHHTFAATQPLLTIVLLGTNVTSVDIVDSRLWTTLASLNLLVKPQYIQHNLKIRLIHPCNLFQQVSLQSSENLGCSSKC